MKNTQFFRMLQLLLLVFLGGGWLSGGIRASDGSTGLRLRESATHAVAGEKLTRTVLLDSTALTAGKGRLFWQTQVASAVVEKGEVELHQGGTGSVSFEAAISFSVPPVSRKVPLHLILRLVREDSVIDSCAIEFQVYPADAQLSWKFMEKIRVGVFDPAGKTRKVIESISPSVQPIASVEELDKQKVDLLIVVSTGVPEKDVVSDFIGRIERLGLQVPVVAFGPVWSASRPDQDSRKGALDFNRANSVFCAGGHSVFREFSDADLRGWRLPGDPVLVRVLPPPVGNFTRFVGVDDGKEVLDCLMLERPLRTGSRVFLCQLPLAEGWDSEPVCRMLLNRLLSQVLTRQPQPHRSGVLLCGPAERALLKRSGEALWGAVPDTAQMDFRVESFPSTAPGAIVLDAGTDSLDALIENDGAFVEKMNRYVAEGGVLVAVGLEPDTRKHFDWALEGECEVEPLNEEAGDVSGDWGQDLLLGFSRQEWQKWVQSPRIEKPLVDFVLKAKRDTSVRTVVQPGALVCVRRGQGQVVFLQVRLDRLSVEASRTILNQILTNLGVRIQYGERVEAIR
jgi:hypothetical protein